MTADLTDEELAKLVNDLDSMINEPPAHESTGVREYRHRIYPTFVKVGAASLRLLTEHARLQNERDEAESRLRSDSRRPVMIAEERELLKTRAEAAEAEIARLREDLARMARDYNELRDTYDSQSKHLGDALAARNQFDIDRRTNGRQLAALRALVGEAFIGTLIDQLEAAEDELDEQWRAKYPDDLGRGKNAALLERASVLLAALRAKLEEGETP